GAFSHDRYAEARSQRFNNLRVSGRESPHARIGPGLFRVRRENGYGVEVRVKAHGQQRRMIAKLGIRQDGLLTSLELLIHPGAEVRVRTARVYERDGEDSAAPIPERSGLAAVVGQLHRGYLLPWLEKVESRGRRACRDRFVAGPLDR